MHLNFWIHVLYLKQEFGYEYCTDQTMNESTVLRPTKKNPGRNPGISLKLRFND